MSTSVCGQEKSEKLNLIYLIYSNKMNHKWLIYRIYL